jgi:ABC-type glycerol-3-phosphate transport system substrate-binding protein
VTGQRFGRRTALRLAGSWALALTGGACTAGGTAARPRSRAAVVEVPVQLHVQAPFSPTLQALVQQYLDEHWNASHRGVRAVYRPWGNMPQVVADTLAGRGPWVIAGCCYDFPTVLPFLVRLDPWLQQDNLPTSLWSAGQLETFRTGDGLYAVPAYTAAQVYFYRQDILDELGLPYPDPEWTYAEAEDLWRRCSGQHGQTRRYGATLTMQPGDIAQGYCYLYGFGGAFADETATRCLLDLPGSIRGGEWAFGLVWDGVCTHGNTDGPGLNTGITTGDVVFCTGSGAAVLWAVENLGTKVKWDFIPFPRWPVRRATGVQVDFYGLSSAARDLELGWELFRLATVDPGWTRFVMGLTLQQPALVDQWSQWEAVVTAAAPLLRDKALHFWADAAAAGEGYGVRFFKYSPLQAIALLDATWPAIWNRQLSVREGFRRIAQQINALQALGPDRQARARQAQAEFPTAGSAEANVPPGV